MSSQHFLKRCLKISVLFVLILPEVDHSNLRVEAQFDADSLVTQKNSPVQFHDRSLGEPKYWSWRFEGAIPEKSYEKNPVVSFPKAGRYNVSLTVSDGQSFDTKHIDQYVKVNGMIHKYSFNGLMRDELNLSDQPGDWNKGEYVRDRKGAIKRALSLNSQTNGRIIDKGQLNTNQLTINFWLKLDEKMKGESILFKREGGTEHLGFELQLIEGKLFLRGTDGSKRTIELSPEHNRIDDRKWHAISLSVSKKSQWQLWLDSILIDQFNNDFDIAMGSVEADLLVNPHHNNKSQVHGALDELQIYNERLSMEAIIGYASYNY